MKVITILDDLSNFNFWGGARDFANKLSYDELEILFQFFEKEFPNGISATAFNDIFWFDQEWICYILNHCSPIQEGIELTVDDIYDRPNRWEVF